ncbi:hypothetical protein [Lutispora sp.]|uniref:hypothetical protein n=1 Tax=Lutispora sp. TaxID=2828727 RepID=UPI003FA57755
MQNAYNPMNWYPWSEDAFVKAKTETRHWIFRKALLRLYQGRKQKNLVHNNKR